MKKRLESKACHSLRVYVLVGYRGDTFDKAEKRFVECAEAGFLPMAMLYRGESGERDPEWVRFTWPWVRPAIVRSKIRVLKEQREIFVRLIEQNEGIERFGRFDTK